MDAGVRNQVSLELVEIDIERTVEAQRRSDGADDLSDEAVKVLVGGARDAEVAAANIVDGLVIDEECAVRILNGAVGRENGVVRLDNGRGNARSRVNGKLELHLFAKLRGKTLLEESAEARASTATKRMEDEETLKGVAVVYIDPC